MGFTATQCTSCSSSAISIIVRENHLNYRCNDCREKLSWPLIETKKKIIYLDQNFYSHSFLGDRNFSSVYSRLKTLAEKQVIVCPYSETHVKETLSFSQKEELWEYIIQLSCGKNFDFLESIRDGQITQAFMDFMNEIAEPSQIYLRHAIEGNIHDWCLPLPSGNSGSSFKSIVEHYNSSMSIREEKDTFVGKLKEVIKTIWIGPKDFSDDFDLEVQDHIRYLMSSNGTLSGELYHGRVMFLQDIMRNYFPQKSEEDLAAFFKPHIFSKIPHVNVAAYLWALVKQDIRTQPPNVRKIEDNYRSISFDIEFLSVLFPYCDAIFTENRMGNYLTQLKNKHNGYKCEIFSAKTFKDFHSYLDEIESGISQDLSGDLKLCFDILNRSKQ